LELAFYKMDDMLETESGKIELQKIKNGDSNDNSGFHGGGDC